MPDEGNEEERKVSIASPDLTAPESLERVSSPAQPYLSTSGAASLASATSVPPPLLSRPSLKASAAATHSSSDSTNTKSTPSLLIHLADSAQRITLSPSPSRPRSVNSSNTDEGLIDLSLANAIEDQQHLEGSGSLGSPVKSDSSVRSQFLTQRLRSAIGDDLVLRESQGISSVGPADGIESSLVAGVANPLGTPAAETSSQLDGSEVDTSDGQKWGWNALGNLSSTLRFEGAFNTAKKTSDEAPTTTSTAAKDPFEGEAIIPQDNAPNGYSLGSYMKPLDVRRWWGTASESTTSGSKERPTSKSRSNSQQQCDGSDGSAKVRDKDQKVNSTTSAATTQPSSPLRGLPAGSFPSSSVTKRSKKKKEQLSRKAEIVERKDESLRSNVKAKEGPRIQEHNLEDQLFGIQGQDGVAFPEREYFVLSTAGKPIFVSYVSKARLKRAAETKQRGRQRQAKFGSEEDLCEVDEEMLAAKDVLLQDEEDQKAATSVGVLQALISNYEIQGMEELQKKSGEVLELPKGTRICYFLRPPLYLAAKSQWGEDESTLANHLEYLYLSILSLVSASKLTRLFDRAANFDLKRLLDGTDAILDKLLTNLQIEASPLFDSLHPLPMDPFLRASAGAALVPLKEKVRPQDALYALLVTQHGIVTLAKRKKKGIHPIDCHLLINTVFATKAMKESGTQSWVPICLPKFAPQGYLYAHVSFLNNEEPRQEESGGIDPPSGGKEKTNLALVLMTSNPDGFEEMSAWRDSIIETLHHQRLLSKLSVAVQQSKASYSISELRLPGLRHFIFKWRSNLQSTAPVFEDPYLNGSDDQKRLISLYGIAQECIYRQSQPSTTKAKADQQSAKAGPNTAQTGQSESIDTPSSPLIKPKSVLADAIPSTSSSIPNPSTNTKPSVLPPPSTALALKRKSVITGQYLLKTSHEIIFVWSTPSFELYLAVGSHLPRNAIINIAKSILKWIKQEEAHLFIANPSIFD